MLFHAKFGYFVIAKNKETGADMASVNKIIKSILNVNDVVIDNASLDLNLNSLG